MAKRKEGIPIDKYAPEQMLRGPVPKTAPRVSPGASSSVPRGLLAAAETARTRGPSRRLRVITRVLAAIAAGLALLILAGTLLVLFRKPSLVLTGNPVADGAPAGNPEGGGTAATNPIAAGSAPAGSPIAAGNPVADGSPDGGRTAGASSATAGNPVRSGSSVPGQASPGASGSPQTTAVFTGIGRLRIAAASSPGTASPVPNANGAVRATVVLSVVFSYPTGDRPFTEELAGKIPRFRQIIRDYFGPLSLDELSPLDEDRAKAELLRRFNDELQLGKIEALLFNDLMILE